MLERIKLGNKEDLKQLFYSYSRKVFGTAYLILKDKGFAEDAVQETFIQVYKKIHSLNSAFAFESWLYKITVNCCLTLMKKNKTSTTITTDEEYIATTIDLYSSQESPEKSYLERETCTELLKLIRSLPSNQHIPIMKRNIKTAIMLLILLKK